MVDAAPVQGKISIKRVGKVYPSHTGNDIKALEYIHMDIEPGEFVCIIGPSGCGKSTLLRLIAGLETPSQGFLLVDDTPITGPDCSRGLVFQDPLLFPWKTVWQNVAAGLEARGLLKERRRDVDKFLELVGLQNFAGVYPHQLSGGMAQRAALARALVNQPAVLLLDEPLGALDALTRMTLQDEIMRIWNNWRTTMLFVTHDIDEAIYLSDRIIVMTERPGRVKQVLAIDLPRPRVRDAGTFFQYRQALLALLGIAHQPANHESGWRMDDE